MHIEPYKSQTQMNQVQIKNSRCFSANPGYG
jgi:hypothetical protein